MFRKLHIQMTLFSGFVTSTILVIMSIAFLSISEKGIIENNYAAFSQNAQSCIIYLETQNVISHQWLQKVHNTYNISLNIRDNGHALFFDSLHPTLREKNMTESALKLSLEQEGIDLINPATSIQLTDSALFSTKDYHACAVIIPRQDKNVLSVLILQSLDSQKAQIRNQRIFVFAAASVSVLALFVFSWFFTSRMIRPLKDSHKAQTEFIAAASHELRSPVTVILSNLQAMTHASPEEQKHFSSIIQKEGHRMSRLIGDMLSIANADNHSWKMFPSPCELDTLLLDTFEKYEHLMRKNNLQLCVQLPEEILPSCTCDASRISQVLSILLDNAMAYVPEGGRVHLSLSEEAKAFCITVSDNGPGIPARQKELIFRRFYRTDTSRNSKEHFGLGLCIAREIIHLHKGTLKLTDTPGGGATFTIHLPK